MPSSYYRAVVTLAVGLLALLNAPPSSFAAQPNVLFIAVDDLRPQLGCYGVDWMKTLNIDRLAASGTLFNHHYVSIAICIPSRVALLTSLRPERTQQIYGPMRWQKVTDASSVGRAFHRQGYRTVSLGKIWHTQNEPNGDSWDTEWRPRTGQYAAEIGIDKTVADNELVAPQGDRPVAEALDVPDETYGDGQVRQRAVQELKQFAAEKDRPFFLAVGFSKPHLPFVAPKKYWDRYDRAALPLATHPEFPIDAPRIANNRGNAAHREVVTFQGVENKRPMDEATQRLLIHGYAACVSYTDEQIGHLLKTHVELGLDKNTIVVLWGDHGWHLGEVEQWTKATNFERATRSPLLVRVPGKKPGVSERFVETVDIFPTLAELCDLPALPVTDGRSFAPLPVDPAQPWKQAVYHCFNRPGPNGGKTNPIIGYAVRTENARYVEWHEGWNLDGKLVAREFYLYSPSQPDELANLAEKADSAALVAAHVKLLRENSAFITRRSNPGASQPASPLRRTITQRLAMQSSLSPDLALSPRPRRSAQPGTRKIRFRPQRVPPEPLHVY